jgi:hypothetical protein
VPCSFWQFFQSPKIALQLKAKQSPSLIKWRHGSNLLSEAQIHWKSHGRNTGAKPRQHLIALGSKPQEIVKGYQATKIDTLQSTLTQKINSLSSQAPINSSSKVWTAYAVNWIWLFQEGYFIIRYSSFDIQCRFLKVRERRLTPEMVSSAKLWPKGV